MRICNMHTYIDVLFALEQSSWQVVFGLTALVCFTIDGSDLKAAPFATLQSQVPIIIIYGTLRTCLSANPLPSRKKQKSTIACTCLSRTINSAKWTNSSTLQRILTGSSNPDWKLESA